MGSSDNDRDHRTEQRNPIFPNNTETQPIDDPDSPFSGVKFNDEGMQFHDTLPLDSELFETEVVREVNDIGTETQVLEDSDSTAGEGAEVTEVLSSDGEDQLSDGGTSLCKVKDSTAEIGIKDGKGGSEKRKSICSNDQPTKDILVDSDASTEDENSSGCAQRSFTSVRAASLRSSGIASTLSMTPKRGELNLAKINSEDGPEQKQANGKSLDHSTEGIRKDNGTASFRYPTFGSMEVCALDHDHNGEKLHSKTQDNVGDETKTRIGKTMARKLFDEISPSGDEEMTSKANSPTLGRDSPQLLVSDHAIAGLSYVDSQEPGEQSQANAWNIVDKFLSINDVQLSGEVDHGKTDREKSPPMSSAKGAKSLAERTDFKSPVGQAGVFDWIDSREDEGGGDFFSRRKNVLLEGSGKMLKSHTLPPKPKHRTFRQIQGAVDGFEEENASPQVHHKINSSTRSDSGSGLVLNRSTTKSQTSRTITKKNLLKEMGKALKTDVSGQKLETSVTCSGVQGICDVGVDTQMAAEALEALVCDLPPNHDVPDAHLLKRNVTEGSIGAARKNTSLKRVCVRKKVCSSSDSEGKARQCKQTKKLSAKLCRGNPSSQKQLKHSRAKETRGKRKQEENLNTGKSSNENVFSNGKSPDTVKKRKTEQELAGTHIHGADEHHLSSMSKKCVSFRVLDGTVTPVAKRTRKPLTTNSLKMAENFSNHSHPMEVSILGSKSRGSGSVIDLPEPVTVKDKSLNFFADQVGKFSNNKTSRQEIKATEGLNEKIPRTGYMTGDFISYPRGRRTRRRMPRECMHPESDHNTLSSGKLPKTSDFSVMNEKIPLKDQITPTSGTLTRSGRKYGADYSLSSVKDAGGNDTIGQSNGKVQTSGTPCTTPSKELNAVSPVCAGDDRTEQSGRKILSRSSLMRELIRLGTQEVARTPAWKDMRRRRDMASVHVLFSHHLGEDMIKQQKKILARLGVPIASSSSDATHFVADKFVRTRNMLEAIALGKPVVTHLWLESCGQASCFIDEKNYILRDTKKEKEIGFNMPVSLARACSSPLLMGKRVFITHNVKPDRELIVNLVKAAHGQVLVKTEETLVDGKVPSNLLVISCEEDYALCAPLLEKGAEVYSSELLLNGIVIQKLEYISRHRLFMDHVKRTRSSIRSSEDGGRIHPKTKHK
ncbi:mediator of DNA damage checkpoint protein 1 isoform X1 [Cinnamomum micranthum f. kanehirae]|uniref:Mediator of DNA damage checkpoint protein 1 isoform X1 n=1 Tax=Cinnamomum micranthum f. kanehirae TaxID=337451 RepID=A0A443NDG4_9MAGN|nr:mediator of DNA damage checkpoint protein 1 isoform X1 [Cinnamomum micranthum f. kanehirae]